MQWPLQTIGICLGISLLAGCVEAPVRNTPMPMANKSTMPYPHGNQPYNNGQPHVNQPYNNGQPHVNQPYNNGQPHVNQPYNNGQPHVNQPYNNGQPINNGCSGRLPKDCAPLTVPNNSYQH